MGWVWFMAGWFVGGIVGFFVAAILAAAGRADDISRMHTLEGLNKRYRDTIQRMTDDRRR